MLNANTYELIIGGGLKIAGTYFFEADIGFLYREFGGYTEKGLGIIAQFGRYFDMTESLKFKVSLPVVFKIVTTGLTRKIIIDYVPYIGISYFF
jgi:hypothetical protein